MRGQFWTPIEGQYSTPFDILDTYLNKVRPVMCPNLPTAAVWVGMKRRVITEASIAKIFRRRTERWFGQGHGPHWVRACITTTVAMEAPDGSLDAAIMLGHNPEIALKHYNKANATAALGRHAQRIRALRQTTAPLAASIYGRRK